MHELNPTPRSKSGVEVSEELVAMFSDQPVDEWAEILDKSDLPHDYMVTFAALLATIFSLVFPWFITFHLIKSLAYAIIPE